MATFVSCHGNNARQLYLGVSAGQGLHPATVAVQYEYVVMGHVELFEVGRHRTRYGYLRELVVGEIQTSEFGTETGEVQGDTLDVIVGEVQLTQAIEDLFSTFGGVPLDGEVGVADVETVVETSLSGLVWSYHVFCVIRATGVSALLRERKRERERERWMNGERERERK